MLEQGCGMIFGFSSGAFPSQDWLPLSIVVAGLFSLNLSFKTSPLLLGAWTISSWDGFDLRPAAGLAGSLEPEVLWWPHFGSLALNPHALHTAPGLR